MTTNGSIRVRDGRAVSYAECGDPSGRPVFYMHGFPSSRLEAVLHRDAAAATRTRLIGIDRPGYGASAPADLAVADIAQDVLDVADSLGLRHFGVVGVSGGGAYALACGAAAPGRVTAVALLAPLGPPDAPRYGMRPANRLMLAIAGRRTSLFAALQRVAAFVVRRRGENVVRRFAKTLPEHERLLVEDAGLRRDFTAVLVESFAQKGAGAAVDGPRLCRPWGIDLADIRPPVRIWHGLVDDIVPPGMSGFLQARLGGAPLLVSAPRDGHFSLVRNCIGEALAWIAASTADEATASRPDRSA